MKKKTEPSKQHSSKLVIDTHQKTILEITTLVQSQVQYIQKIIQRTILSMNQYKKYEIFSNSEVILCITTLTELFDKCQEIYQQTASLAVEDTVASTSAISGIIEKIQLVVDKLSIILCGFGTSTLEDLFFITFGSNEVASTVPLWKSKLDVLFQHAHPIGYKTFYWKNKIKPREIIVSPDSTTPLCCDKMGEDSLVVELCNQFECLDVDTNTKSVYVRIYGIRLVVHNEKTQKTVVVQCILDDTIVDCITNSFLQHRKREITQNMPEQDLLFDRGIMTRILETATLKDMLVFSNTDIYKKHFAVLNEVNSVKITKLDTTIKKFLELDICDQRQMLIHLLIYNKEDDIQYITYLLYDLITANHANGTTADSLEQMLIYESFPWKIKLYFKDTMKNTIKYTKDMMHKYDINRITLEQQIYVMKAPENVKEKAMLKLKEIKGKIDDSGTKAKQYLEGLLKIPFGIYREEPLLKKVKLINAGFVSTVAKQCPILAKQALIPKREKYTMIEIAQHIDRVFLYLESNLAGEIETYLNTISVRSLNSVVSFINGIYKTGATIRSGLKSFLPTTTKSKEEKINYAAAFFKTFEYKRSSPASIRFLEYYSQIYDIIHPPAPTTGVLDAYATSSLVRTVSEFDKTRSTIREIKTNLSDITDILDDSIHGHTHAKSQILKIIGQWMNGEQSGYCFGFEGSPGIGKTSLAKKGLANCLKNATGESRPFAFIALGGSCNGSTLEGHSYTYVNSTWGRIVDILMDTKCMNPIIYIDELDKVSKTEHGKEIIGILTHLIDTTQNDVFQDKYFSGIDIDLSKALFIFSYNDPAQIDRILLDRIHRIKFDNLSLDEKVVIVRKYILPEINRKMGFADAIELSDDVIEFLVCTYTFESGVRKLKEVLFDLFGEINIEFLNNPDGTGITIPYVLTEQEIREKYLKKYDKITDKIVHTSPEIGVINGLWASMYGKGGIIPIQTMLFPSTTFLDLKLTGSQGDVMKESMNVAKSVAWNLLSPEQQQQWIAEFEKTKTQGLHIHCPDGATSKDGPSAGVAITVCIYSLFTKRPIRPDIAMTGEITLRGNATEIGGLEDKILGGIKAGVKKFLYPVGNKPEFTKFWEKYGTKKIVDGIEFVEMATVQDTFAHVFADAA